MQEIKQLQATEKFEAIFKKLTETIINAQNEINHLSSVKDEVKEEFEALKETQDKLEIYNEQAAAEILSITPKHLSDMRRKLKLPHCKFGDKVRYTKSQLIEIVELMSVHSQNKKTKK